MGSSASAFSTVDVNNISNAHMQELVVAWAIEHECFTKKAADALAQLVFQEIDGELEGIIKKRIENIGVPNDDEDVREDWHDMEALHLIFKMLESRLRKSKIDIILQCEHGDDIDVSTPSLVSAKPIYPMYVIPIVSIMKENCPFNSLPIHEIALKQGLLLEVVEKESDPGNFNLYEVDSETGKRGAVVVYNREYSFESKSYTSGDPRSYIRSSFLNISHQWLRPHRDSAMAHPDSEDNIKLRTLQEFLSLGVLRNEKFLWMDYLSIPQTPGSEEQVAAIRSLPSYFMYSTSSVILCENEEKFRDTSKGYLSRGHCLLELASMRIPRIDTFGRWYVPGYEEEGHWGSTIVVYMKNNDNNATIDNDHAAGDDGDGATTFISASAMDSTATHIHAGDALSTPTTVDYVNSIGSVDATGVDVTADVATATSSANGDTETKVESKLRYKKIGWEDFSECRSPLQGNFTFEADRKHVKALLEKYLVVYDYFDRMFLQSMRSFEGCWEEYMARNEVFLPQLSTTYEMRQNPEFSVKHMPEWLLPSFYPRKFRESILEFGGDADEC